MDLLLISYEIMLCLFYGTFMFFVVGLLGIMHPGKLFREVKRTKKMLLDYGGAGYDMTPLASSM